MCVHEQAFSIATLSLCELFCLLATETKTKASMPFLTPTLSARKNSEIRKTLNEVRRDKWKVCWENFKACASTSHESHVFCTPFALLTTYPTTPKQFSSFSNKIHDKTSRQPRIKASTDIHVQLFLCLNSQDILGHGRSKVSKTILNSAISPWIAGAWNLWTSFAFNFQHCIE